MSKVTNPSFLDVLQFLAKKHHRKPEIHNLPVISNVRAVKGGFLLNLRLYNRKKKAWDKKKDVKFADKDVIEVLEYQMNYRSEEDQAMMRKDFVPKEEKVNMKDYNQAKFGKPAPKKKNGPTMNVIIMDENGSSSEEMDMGQIHETLSRIL